MNQTTKIKNAAGAARRKPRSSAVADPIVHDLATAAERSAYHLKQFMRASEELDPEITNWTRGEYGDIFPEQSHRFVLIAYQQPKSRPAEPMSPLRPWGGDHSAKGGVNMRAKIQTPQIPAKCPDDPLDLLAERNRLIDTLNCSDDGGEGADDLDKAIEIENLILSAEPVTPQIVEAQFSVIARLVNEGFSLDCGQMSDCLRRLKEHSKSPVAVLNSEMLKTPLGSIADVVAKLEMAASILEDDGDDSLAQALRQAADYLGRAGKAVPQPLAAQTQNPHDSDEANEAYDAADLAAMLAEHDANVAWFNRRRAPDWSEEDHQEKEEAIYERAHDLRRAIFQAPADTPEAFAVKLRLAVQLEADGRLDDMPGLGDTLRQLLAFLQPESRAAA